MTPPNCNGPPPVGLNRSRWFATTPTGRPPSRANIDGFRSWAIELPEVVGVFVVAGAEDFLLHVAVADNEALYAFVIDRLTERPEVADVRTSVVYEHVRPAVVRPEPSATTAG